MGPNSNIKKQQKFYYFVERVRSKVYIKQGFFDAMPARATVMHSASLLLLLFYVIDGYLGY